MNVAVKHRGQTVFDKVIQLYQEADQADLRVKYIIALGQASDPQIIEQFLSFGFGGILDIMLLHDKNFIK